MDARRRKAYLVWMGWVAGTVALSACASAGTGRKVRQDIITREEILEVESVTSLYEVVQRLRPRWLTIRAGDRTFGGSTTEIAVYQDQAYMGDTEVLKQMGRTLAWEVRWIDGQTAMTTLPGLGSGRFLAGAIVVITTPPDKK